MDDWKKAYKLVDERLNCVLHAIARAEAEGRDTQYIMREKQRLTEEKRHLRALKPVRQRAPAKLKTGRTRRTDKSEYAQIATLEALLEAFTRCGTVGEAKAIVVQRIAEIEQDIKRHTFARSLKVK